MFSSNKNSRKGLLRQRPACPAGRRGQNITEYLILVAGVLVVVILAVNSRGIFTRGVNKSINMMFESVEDMATVECLGTIDDVNGKWSGWSAYAGCGWDATSSSCLEYSTRACNSPEPRCGGLPCRRLDGSYTTPTGPTETQSRGCYAGSWQTGTCAPGGCTGSCGSTIGTCAVAVTCPPDNCCDPAAKPPETIACTKPAYPDVWSGLGFGSCSVSCDAGISSQTVTCSGMCCDAATKPPTRRACADGCCAQDLYIGRDIVNNVDFTGTFGPAANGASVTLTCPSGYGGTPTRTCTATADSAGCTGNDSYVPPASCYNIAWGALSGECRPADCDPETADVGFGSYTLDYEFPFTLHGDTAYIDCSTLTQTNGARHTGGIASYECWLGAWRNLNAPCIPNCPREDNVFIGEDLYQTFPETFDDVQATLTCSDYDEVPAGLGTKKYVNTVTRDCGILPLADGQWGSVNGECDFKPCDGTAYPDNNAVLEGWFGNGTRASPGAPVAHGTPVTLTCSDIDTRYDGTFSRTCTYGDWIPEDPYGGCAAKRCDPWTTDIPDSNGVSVTFAGTGHDTPRTGAWTDNTYDCSAAAQCCFGQWFDAGTDCGTVTSDQINGVNDYSGTCAPYECTGTEPSGDMSMCSGDGTDLTATDVVDWSVVEYDSCTARKCEYQCSQYYYKSGNNCYLAICDGSAPGSASGCPGDERNLTASQNGTLRHLVSDCVAGAACDASRCTAGDKCEYYCPSGTVVYNGGCCTPKTCGDLGYCARDSGTGTLQYPDNGCGVQITCRECCGDGSIGSGEVCDKNGPIFNPSQDTCSEVNSSYNGGTLACTNSCTFDTTNCCTWGSWSGWSHSNGYSDGASGTCSKACDTGTQSRSQSCMNGTTTISTQSESQNCNTQACCVPKTCGASDCGVIDDGCGGTIDCGACGPVCGANGCESGEDCTTCPQDCGGSSTWVETSRTYIGRCFGPGPNLTGQSCCPLDSITSSTWYYNSTRGCATSQYQCGGVGTGTWVYIRDVSRTGCGSVPRCGSNPPSGSCSPIGTQCCGSPCARCSNNYIYECQ